MLNQCPSVSPTIPPPACPAYVDVVLPLRLHRHFTYLVPSELQGKVAVGQSVIVPFGAQDLHGLVIAVHPRLPPGAPHRGIKPIRSLAEACSDEQLTVHQIELSRWIAERYAAHGGNVSSLYRLHSVRWAGIRYGISYRSKGWPACRLGKISEETWTGNCSCASLGARAIACPNLLCLRRPTGWPALAPI